jgi:5'-phosphate synthase pdxT subunit
MLERLGVSPVRVTLPGDLADLKALVMPGGESTTLLRLIEATGLREPLEHFVHERPVLATCAGLILLGRGAERLPARPFEVMDVEVERNAYGRQLDSYEAKAVLPELGGPVFPAVFIRAPRIRACGPAVEVVARLELPHGPAPAGEPVGVREGLRVGLCFHPELTGDTRLHAWFLSEVAGLELPSGAAPTRRSEAGERA